MLPRFFINLFKNYVFFQFYLPKFRATLSIGKIPLSRVKNCEVDDGRLIKNAICRLSCQIF